MRPNIGKASFTWETLPLQHPPSEVIFFSVIVFLDYHHFFLSLVFWCCVFFPPWLMGTVPKTSKFYFAVGLDIFVAFLAHGPQQMITQRAETGSAWKKHWAFVVSLRVFASSVLYISCTSCSRNRHYRLPGRTNLGDILWRTDLGAYVSGVWNSRKHRDVARRVIHAIPPHEMYIMDMVEIL